MSEKYLVFAPVQWDHEPSAETRRAVLSALIQRGIVVGDPDRPDSLRNGPAYPVLWRDTDPKPALEGEGLGCDPGNMRVRIDAGEVRGYGGDNLEPVACPHCTAEMPYDQAQDAFFALKEGEGLESDRLGMECYHCGRTSPAVTADFGPSGGFARYGIVFEGETSNRVDPNADGLSWLSELAGTPMRFIQVFGW